MTGITYQPTLMPYYEHINNEGAQHMRDYNFKHKAPVKMTKGVDSLIEILLGSMAIAGLIILAIVAAMIVGA